MGTEIISLAAALILSVWLVQACWGVFLIAMPHISDKPVTKREVLNWLFNPAYSYYRMYKLFKELK